MSTEGNNIRPEKIDDENVRPCPADAVKIKNASNRCRINGYWGQNQK